MKQKFNAGAMLDVLTVDELRGVMREYMVDIAKGIQPVAIAAQGITDTNSKCVMGGSYTLTGGTLGPEAGFVWAVTRLSVRVAEIPSAFSVYYNTPGSHRVIRDVDGSANGYVSFGSQECIVKTGESLVFSMTGTASGQPVTVTGQAIEIPNQLLWKYLGA